MGALARLSAASSRICARVLFPVPGESARPANEVRFEAPAGESSAVPCAAARSSKSSPPTGEDLPLRFDLSPIVGARLQGLSDGLSLAAKESTGGRASSR